MKRMTLVLAAILALASFARAELVREQWAGKGAKATHPNTLKVINSRLGPRLAFDLSAITKGAKVYHASLYCFTGRDAQPVDPARLFAVAKVDADGTPALSGKPLELEAPWYRSFDVTGAVQSWVKDPAANLGIAVERFEGFVPPRTYLEVLYDGKPGTLPEQAAGIRVVHHDGQTFIVFKEFPAFRPKDDEVIWVTKFSEDGDKLAEGPGDGDSGMPNHPCIILKTLRRLQGLGLRDKPSGIQGIKGTQRVAEVPAILHYVYRYTEKITQANIDKAERLAAVAPLSGYDEDAYGIHFKGEFLDQWEEPSSPIITYSVDKGKNLIPGEGLYVHTVRQPGKFFYAVTTALDGTENVAQISDANSLAEPVPEQPATPQPVLQWIQEDHYHKTVPEYWYRYWAAPPYYHLPSRAFRLAVSASDKLKQPCPLIIGSISGDFNVRGSLNLPSTTAVTIEPECQHAWMPNLFYNEGEGTLRGMTECKVDYFTERYMDFMIKWIMAQYQIDRSQISGDMLHFGLRHPEIFTRMQMGTYTAGYDLRFAPGGPSMSRLLGPQGIKTARGEDAWKMYSVSEYVNTHPDRDIPYLICISGTGKDGGHTSEFGWQDDPRGWAGLLKARQTFVASWSENPPVTKYFKDLRWDVSIPAFANCSIDDNPGNGDPADGDFYGTINGWLLWGDKDLADEKDKWEMSVWIIPECPEDACTVDVTPRRCANFKPKPGDKFTWTNTSLADNKVVQNGSVTADKWGLVTIDGAVVTKGRNRLAIIEKK